MLLFFVGFGGCFVLFCFARGGGLENKILGEIQVSGKKFLGVAEKN